MGRRGPVHKRVTSEKSKLSRRTAKSVSETYSDSNRNRGVWHLWADTDRYPVCGDVGVSAGWTSRRGLVNCVDCRRKARLEREYLYVDDEDYGTRTRHDGD